LIEDVLGHKFIGHLICDNESAIKVGKEDSSNKRTRHTKREFYIINQALFEKKGNTVVGSYGQAVSGYPDESTDPRKTWVTC
jgi:hypothetical protein